MNTPTLTSLASSIGGRLGLCAAALVAVAAPLSEAQAVVVTTFANTSVPIPQDSDGIYLNFLTGATGTAGASTPGWDFNPYLSNSVLTFFWPSSATNAGGVASAATGPYLDLPVGTVISASSIFSRAAGAGGAGSTINFQTPGNRILGFRFTNEATATVNYGYLTMTTGGSAGFPATITGWVFENNGGPITVVPEPGTYALMLAGLVAVGGIAARRRKAA